VSRAFKMVHSCWKPLYIFPVFCAVVVPIYRFWNRYAEATSGDYVIDFITTAICMLFGVFLSFWLFKKFPAKSTKESTHVEVGWCKRLWNWISLSRAAQRDERMQAIEEDRLLSDNRIRVLEAQKQLIEKENMESDNRIRILEAQKQLAIAQSDARVKTLQAEAYTSNERIRFMQAEAEWRLTTSRTQISLNSRNMVIKAVCHLRGNVGVDGVVWFNQQSVGAETTIKGEITGLTPGLHGFHIYQYGDSNDCESAGPHFNPFQMTHGGPLDSVRHVGDLGNVHADQYGLAKFEFTDKLLQLSGDNSVVGRSCVVHAGEDDLGRGVGDTMEESKKTGNAGDRLACGVVALAAV